MWQPHRDVLAYATSMSRSALLSSTNQQRSANGSAALALNSKLNNAAQAKANDMVARDYWAHNTPDGNPPWVFFDNAGYAYVKAGENLAYGFATSADTITGWMNSPEHRANLLDKDFVDVGFGFANSSNFVGTGPQTIVVAEYGDPLNPAPAATTAPSTTSYTPQTKAAEAQVAPVSTTPKKKTSAPAKKTVAKAKTEQPANTETPYTNFPTPKSVSRLSVLTGPSMAWISSAAAMIGIAALAFFTIRHSWTLHRWIVRGERYVVHHMVFDATIISLIGLCYMVTHAAGAIL